MPYPEYPYLAGERHVVDVVAHFSEQQTAHIANGRPAVNAPDLRCGSDEFKGFAEFFQEQVWRSLTILSPPRIDFPYLEVNFRCGLNRKTHRRRRALHPKS